MPETQQEILRLSRDVESGRAVYMQLLNRQQELSIAKSSAIGNVRIIDNAVTQPKPVKPKSLDCAPRFCFRWCYFNMYCTASRFPKAWNRISRTIRRVRY